MKPFPRESRTRIKFTRGNIGMAHDIPDRVIPFQYPTHFHQCLDLHRRVGMPIGCTSLFNSREDFIRHDLFVEPSKPPCPRRCKGPALSNSIPIEKLFTFCRPSKELYPACHAFTLKGNNCRICPERAITR